MDMATAGACGLEGKIFSRADKHLQAFDHESAGGEGATFRVQRREAARDFVGIHELANAELRQQAKSHGGFACPVGSTEHNNVLCRTVGSL